jgi:hypothetical protein
MVSLDILIISDRKFDDDVSRFSSFTPIPQLAEMRAKCGDVEAVSFFGESIFN